MRLYVGAKLHLGGKAYRLTERLSGLREVYKAFDSSAGPTGAMRAVHIVKNNASNKLAALKAISTGSSNVPKIWEYHKLKGRVCLITDWIEGTALNRTLGSKTLGLSKALRLYRGLAHTLTQFHNHGFVHGDVKPANLILATEPERLVLIDFGSSWTIETTTRRSSGDGYSPEYSAPEQQDEKPFVDKRSDQFSATVVFYEMLTGRLPYAGLGGSAGRDSQKESFSSSFVKPSQCSSERNRFHPAIWRELDQLTATALAFDLDARYPNPGAWLDAIKGTQRELATRPRLTFANRMLLGAIDAILRLGGRSTG